MSDNRKFDSEAVNQIINCIGALQYMYDPSEEDYCNINKRESTWQEIATMTGRPARWCKGRWKFFRHVYRQVHKKAQIHADNLSRYTLSVLAKMDFLKNVAEEIETPVELPIVPVQVPTPKATKAEGRVLRSTPRPVRTKPRALLPRPSPDKAEARVLLPAPSSAGVVNSKDSSVPVSKEAGQPNKPVQPVMLQVWKVVIPTVAPQNSQTPNTSKRQEDGPKEKSPPKEVAPLFATDTPEEIVIKVEPQSEDEDSEVAVPPPKKRRGVGGKEEPEMCATMLCEAFLEPAVEDPGS